VQTAYSKKAATLGGSAESVMVRSISVDGFACLPGAAQGGVRETLAMF
jgi:hypothetical protein